MKKARVRRGKSNAGLGLFAVDTFVRGECIIEYTGEHITHDEANRRGGKYLFILDKKTVVDGKGREHLGRYINHACKPNAEAEVDEEEQKIYIKAKRKIAIGEEITYHYGKEYWNEYIKPRGCKCDACTTNHRTYI